MSVRRIKGNTDPGPRWRTRDGVEVLIRTMPTSHLLNAIHFIERNRMQQLQEFLAEADELEEICPGIVNADLDYYTGWPEGYDNLINEALHRQLIKRG